MGLSQRLVRSLKTKPLVQPFLRGSTPANKKMLNVKEICYEKINFYHFINGKLTVDANIKVLAIGRVGEQRIGDKRSGILSILDLSGAVELNDICVVNIVYKYLIIRLNVLNII